MFSFETLFVEFVGLGRIRGLSRRVWPTAPHREVLSFLVIAALQALVNYGVYLLMLRVASWQIAFLAAAAAGIGLQRSFKSSPRSEKI